MRLAGVFNDGDAAPGRNFKNRIHVGALAEEMNRNDGFGSGGDGGFEQVRIESVSALVNIHELWPCRAVTDGLRSGHESVGRRDDFIAWADAKGQQTEPKSIGAVADANGKGRTAVLGEFTLESSDKRAAGKRIAVNDVADGGVKLFAHGLVMGAEIQKGNLHKQFAYRAGGLAVLITRAGFPATTAPAGTSRVTTLPAPTMAPGPMVMPHKSVAPEPMDAPRLT